MKFKIKHKDLITGKELSKVGRKGLKIRKGKILTIILHEGKGSTWYQLDENQERFSIEGNTYFRVDDGTYIKGGIRFLIYLEGISLPIHHGYIERELVEKTITDQDTGQAKKYRFYKIKGLNFDSKIMDILLNRHLADEFTRQHLDLPNIAIILLLVGTLVFSIISVAVEFI